MKYYLTNDNQILSRVDILPRCDRGKPVMYDPYGRRKCRCKTCNKWNKEYFKNLIELNNANSKSSN